MAVKRYGFNDNFTQPRSWGPGGSGWQGSQGLAKPRPPQPRAWGPGGSGWQETQGFTPPKVKPVAAPQAGAPGTTPVKPAAAPAPRPSLDDPEILSDPILMKVKKAQETRRGDIRAGALARKKQLAIQTGDSGLAREFGLDDTVAQVAAQNPLSAFAAIRDAAKAEEFDLEEGLNKANLHFGGYRGTQLGELAKSILAREANAQAQARQAFSGIEDELLGGLGAADDAEMQAEMAAYDRAVARRAAGLAGSGGVPAPGPVAGGPGGATDPFAGSGLDPLIAELAGIPPVVPPAAEASTREAEIDPTFVPLRPFDETDPYYGGSLADVRAELASIPQAASTPPPLLPLVPPAPTFAPPAPVYVAPAPYVPPQPVYAPPAPAPIAAPAAAAPAIRDIAAELASIPRAPVPAPAPAPVFTPPPAPPLDPILAELMKPAPVDPILAEMLRPRRGRSIAV